MKGICSFVFFLLVLALDAGVIFLLLCKLIELPGSHTLLRKYGGNSLQPPRKKRSYMFMIGAAIAAMNVILFITL